MNENLVGRKILVTENTTGHEVAIGSEVYITKVFDDHVEVKVGDLPWYLEPNEFVAIT